MRHVAISVLALAALLGGCAQTPLAPTVAATAGPGKSDADFKADQDACKQTAAQAVSGQAETANVSAAAGAFAGVLGAGGGSADSANAAITGLQASHTAQAGVQAAYDTAYDNCMVARNDVVPGMAPPVAEAAAPPPDDQPVTDPLVRRVQVQLIRLGYLHGHADGQAGPKTAAAITSFEQDHQIAVDGVSSHHLLASLQGVASAPVVKAAGWDAPPPPAAQ